MCGVGGIAAGEGSALREPMRLERELERLCERLAHRGPDARGVAIAANVGLAHTRLAIQDLSEAGAQPMASPDGRWLISYNGEVYNFGRLRSELDARGERFRGHSDTEVVLRLLARDGPRALARLDGMFALALLDTRTGEVLLARDASGQKPLYVAELAGGGFAFASELAPLLDVPGAVRALSRTGLSHLLTFGFAPHPFTLRSGVRQLAPGTTLLLRAGAPPREERFAPEPGPRQPRLAGSLEELSRELEQRLSDAVRDHLVADVPVGVLLSGGVDSSTIAALAARHAGRVQTFCVAHEDPAYDESAAARAVAQAISSEHHEIRLPASGLSENDLDAIVDHCGDPFADSSALNVRHLSREMRKHVTVALSGDGGDEVFAGYDRFRQLRWLGALGRAPAPLLGALERAAMAFGAERAFQAARSFRVAAMPPARRAVAFGKFFWPEEQAEILRPEWRPEPGELERLLEARGASLERDPVASAHWLEQRLHLPDDMLTKVDRMSMTVALEVRPPLLAAPVLDFAARLPFAAKQRGTAGKRVLRTLARRLVPAWVIDRPKRGFALPLAEHGGAVLEEAARFALESQASPLRLLFLPEALGRLAAELGSRGPRRHPEDSAERRIHRRWLLVLLARALARQGM
jgi:asparagine synthase (glutamine-hydrolysing)